MAGRETEPFKSKSFPLPPNNKNQFKNPPLNANISGNKNKSSSTVENTDSKNKPNSLKNPPPKPLNPPSNNSSPSQPLLNFSNQAPKSSINYAKVTSSEHPLDKKCAIILNTVEGLTQLQYLEAMASFIDPTLMHAAYRMLHYS